MPYVGQQSPSGNEIWNGSAWVVAPWVDVGYGLGVSAPDTGAQVQQAIAQQGDRAGLYAGSAAPAYGVVTPHAYAPAVAAGTQQVAPATPTTPAMLSGGPAPWVAPRAAPGRGPAWAEDDWAPVRGGPYLQYQPSQGYPRMPGYPGGARGWMADAGRPWGTMGGWRSQPRAGWRVQDGADPAYRGMAGYPRMPGYPGWAGSRSVDDRDDRSFWGGAGVRYAQARGFGQF